MKIFDWGIYFSLNDSFAHVKRELTAKKYRNEMMDFMWSTFRKVAGINNRRTSESKIEEIKLKNMNSADTVPLATMDFDDL